MDQIATGRNNIGLSSRVAMKNFNKLDVSSNRFNEWEKNALKKKYNETICIKDDAYEIAGETLGCIGRINADNTLNVYDAQDS